MTASETREHPVALRPLGAYPPDRRSPFEDPSDEKTWYVSQTPESLLRFYGDRAPDWYTSAVRPLAGCSRVIDLGAGTSLALRQLRAAGVRDVLGIERWPTFARIARQHDVPFVLHDITVPMPFLPSGSCDGVFSHFVLYYVSPIGVRLALREAHRILAPDGRLLIYLAANGQLTGDVSRTIAYTPELVTRFAEDAGFAEVAAELSPNGRNITLTARRGHTPLPSIGRDATFEVGADTQLTAAARANGGLTVSVEGLDGPALHFDLPHQDGTPAISLRLVGLNDGTLEVQSCVWRGQELARAGAVVVHGRAAQVTVHSDQPLDHAAAWTPGPMAYEPAGDARHEGPGSTDRAAGSRLMTVVDQTHAWARPDPLQFALRRIAEGADVEALDRDWRDDALHAVLVGTDTVPGASLVTWAAARGVPIYLDARDWQHAADQANALSPSGATVVLGAAAQDAPPSHLVAAPGRHVLLRRDQAGDDVVDDRRVLLTGSGTAAPALEREASENLRYLTERALLLRLQATHVTSPQAAGRLPSLRGN